MLILPTSEYRDIRLADLTSVHECTGLADIMLAQCTGHPYYSSASYSRPFSYIDYYNSNASSGIGLGSETSSMLRPWVKERIPSTLLKRPQPELFQPP